MNKLTLSIAVAALFAAGAQAADKAVPSAGRLPPYAADKPLPGPTIAKKTMASGREVWVVPRRGLPRVDFVLAVSGAGFVADDAQHPGFSNLMAGLLNKGAGKRSPREIAEMAQSMGGSVGAGSSNDGINVVANALASRAGDMMSLLAEVARQP